jgi:hypothetical protein
MNTLARFVTRHGKRKIETLPSKAKPNKAARGKPTYLSKCH